MSLVFNQKITLDLTVSRVQNVHCSQDDDNSRNILITLSDKGKPYILTDNEKIFFKISKPDNTFIYIDEDDSEHLYRNDDGTISIILSEQATYVPGICEAELQIMNSDKVVSTRKFNIVIKKSVISDKEIESTIESNVLQKLIHHLMDYTNPHRVTKEQVGLENVENLSINDQIPIYEETAELENISSGEKISVAFGKLKRAITSLISHINNFDNPHMLTKNQIELGNVDNTSDVNKPVSTAQQKAIDDAYANSNKYTDKKVADLIDGAPETLDTLKEVAEAIEKSKTVENALNSAIGKKANQTELDTHIGNDTIHITSDERTKWNNANDKKHSHDNKSVLDGITSELVEKWTETSSSSVTGIKGVNEDSFRRGNVVLTAENVGAVSTGGDTAENTTAFTAAPARENLKSGESHATLFGKIVKWFSDLKEVAFTGKIPWSDVTGKPSTYAPASHTHDNQYYKKEESDVLLTKLMQSLIKRDEDVKVELIDGYTTADSGLNNRITAVVNELKKYLPLSGGTLTGSLDIASGKYIHGTHTNGTILDILGLNKNNNCHVGNDATPTFLHGAGYQLDISGAFICPNVSNQMSCGTKNKLWTTVFSKTGAINTSDRTKKHNIIDLTEAYEQLFLKLKPKSFIFNDGDRVHIGAISQDVEDAMHELGMSAEEFAGFCKDIRYDYREYNDDGTPVESSKIPCKDEDGNIIYDYALRYQEFIFLTVYMVQKLWNRVEILEKENAEMRDEIKSIQQDITELKKSRA